MPGIFAVIVNWNGGELAVEAARSVAVQTAAPSLWVVDNGSRDGSAEEIARACPAARLIRNERNMGFAAANNQALRHFLDEAAYVLLVNNDALLTTPDSLARAVRYLEENPEVHGVCARYVFPDGGFQRFYNQLPTPFDLAVNWGFGRHFGPLRASRRTRRFHLLDEDFAKPLSLEQPAFACVLMRGESVRAVGLLDERFPIFFNDVDYCWRWRERGFHWRYLPDWTVVHSKSRSTARIGGLLKAEFASTAARFARKHFSAAGAFAVLCALVAEAGWRKYRHGDLPVPLADIWRGKLFFCEPEVASQPPAAAAEAASVS